MEDIALQTILAFFYKKYAHLKNKIIFIMVEF